MRLITRRDTSLAVTLIAGTLLAFERPFRSVLDLIHELELRYHIDLLPALMLLVVVFVCHQYAKRVQTRARLDALAQEVAHTRTRTAELERLLTLGQALSGAWDRHAIEQVLWRTLPSFVGDRECSVVWRQSAGLEFLVRDLRMAGRHSHEAVEHLVATAEAHDAGRAATEGRQVGDDIVFPMSAGDAAIGAVIVRNDPALALQDRLAIGAAGAMVGVAMRNIRLLHDARQSGIKDPLTGCVTRAHALETLDRELRRARRTGRPLSLIMFDIDRFKQINDQHGHLHGDAVLAAVGAELGQVLRSTDVRCRYGGDEFLLILPETPILGAQQVAECLRRHIADAVAAGDSANLRVTASLGVACALPGEHDPAALISRADQALYRAKRGGRDRWCATAVTGAMQAEPMELHAVV